MSNLVGARSIAHKLSQLSGAEVSLWQVYRLARLRNSPLERDEERRIVSVQATELVSWWRQSPLAKRIAKRWTRPDGRRQPAPVKKRVRNQDQLRLFGVIGDGELTDSTFLDALKALGEPKDISVLINSDGGLVSHGLAIYHALRSHAARVEVEIIGVAASMASAIAMAGDKVRMAEDALFMIHDPWVAAAGNSEDLRAAADMLDKHGGSLAAIYARKTGLTEDRIKEMMSKDRGEGTWMNAREALDAGFVDEIIEPANAKLPRLPAAARAKRIVRGARKMKVKANRKSKLSVALVAAIKAAINADTTEETVLENLATEAELEADAIEQAIAGKAKDLTYEHLEAFAEVLDIEADELAEAAKEDGLEIDEPEEPPAPTSRKRQPNANVQKAVRDALIELTRTRAKVTARCKKHGLPEDAIATIAAEAVDLADANDKILAWLSDPKNQKRIDPVHSVLPGDDDRDKWLEGMGQWLLIKSGNARLIQAHAKQAEDKVLRLDPGNFRGFRLLDIARDVLEREGHSCRGMSPKDIVKRALAPRAEQGGLGTRSDFPILLENVMHKMLLAAYETAADKWRMVAATGSVQDFRAHPRLRLGSLPRLSTLLESGEFKQMHFPDAVKESIQAGTFGNIIGLSRQSIINDDVDGFSRLTVMLGRAAARGIDIDVFALFALNSGLGPNLADGDPLFDANHNNIDSNTGAPAVGTIDTARILMGKQKDPNNQDFLDLTPTVWVGSLEKGSAARTATTAEFDFDDETSGNTGKFMKPNTVRNLITTIVDTPRLTGNRWYTLADPNIAPVFEVVFLEGQESPVIEAEEGFDYDGVRWRVRHDYGVGATDHRGATTNAGG